jgi:hypothetical protein
MELIGPGIRVFNRNNFICALFSQFYIFSYSRALTANVLSTTPGKGLPKSSLKKMNKQSRKK